MENTDLAIKRRAARLLDGSAEVIDLEKIFQWARFRSGGNRAVKDIGDFLAHSHEKGCGVAWESARDFATSARFQFYSVSGQRHRINLEMFRAQAWATFRSGSCPNTWCSFGLPTMFPM